MTDSTALKDFYDREALFAARYTTANFWEKRYHVKRMVVLKEILARSLNGAGSFLDVGCGAGEYLLFASDFAQTAYGLDISKRYLLRSKLDKIGGLVLGDSRALPFSNGVFDFVLCSEVIEHVKEQNQAILEVLRVSRNSVLISTPNHGLLRRLMSSLCSQKLLHIDESVGHVAILEFSDLISKLNRLHWKLLFAFTVHVFPPTLDELHVPPFVASIVAFVERFLDKLMPTLGSVSIAYLEAKNVESKLAPNP